MNDDFELNLNEQGLSEEPKQSSKVGAVWSSVSGFVVKYIPRKIRIIAAIMGVTSVIIGGLIASQPQANKRAIPETIVTVDVIQASRSSYPVVVKTNGTIQADTRGNLVSQLRGEIVKVSDKFKTGGAFETGEVLIEIDQRDYLAEVSQALAAVSQAKAALKQEQANAKQAARDWKRLNNTGKAPDLVLREPQLAAARAQMDSAQARYQTAQLNLERTKIKAPYTGRVIRREAALGQYVGVGTMLAEVFATDEVEVRLPLSQDEYNQLGLDQLGAASSQQFKVDLNSQVGSNQYTWDAFVTRADSTFDLNTRQIDVIATVVDPFSKDSKQPPLKIGQFVNASIQGRTLNDVITVPNKSLREGSYVFTSQDNVLVRTPVVIAWQDDQNAVIKSGLNESDLVVTTSLNSTLAGARVKYSEAQNLAAPVVTESANAATESAPENASMAAPEAAPEAAQVDAAAEQVDESSDTSSAPEPGTQDASGSAGQH